jgi:cyclophilin family peptidyl-prolyl cis-trans isomerase
MSHFIRAFQTIIGFYFGLILANSVLADQTTARQAMENPSNPLFSMATSQGEIFIELFARETPNNVANFTALAEGKIELIDESTNTTFKPRYYDGMRFHRVIPGFVIQAGSPSYSPLGGPEELLQDEINADFLGLDEALVLNPDGSFHEILSINEKIDFDSAILRPLYVEMNIETQADLVARQYEVLDRLGAMTLKEVYENLGYRYINDMPSHRVSRGTIALANGGPDQNGPEFFINLIDADYLTGKHTVIGQVVEGMDIADRIGNYPVDPLRFTRLSTVIYAIRRVE